MDSVYLRFHFEEQMVEVGSVSPISAAIVAVAAVAAVAACSFGSGSLVFVGPLVLV